MNRGLARPAASPAVDASAGAPPRTRLVSLDVFRGVTIAAMLLVNKQGDSSAGYAALQHVPWHGATPTDWIFPFFLFIVGVALPFSIAARRRAGASHGEILRHAAVRGLILFALGVFEKNFPFLATTLDTFRIPGVLQRIAFCYVLVTALELYATTRVKALVAAGLLLGYWVVLAFVPVPGAGVVPMSREFASDNWAAWLDQLTMGRHLGYGNRTWDANGLLSSLPAIVTTQAGVLAAAVLQRYGASRRATAWLVLLGMTGLLSGWVWGGFQPLIGLGIIGEPAVRDPLVFPINKMLWTSTYVLFTAGLALLALAASVRAVDLAPRVPSWAAPFIWLGSNAIFAYLASGLVAKLLHVATLDGGAGTRVSWWDWAYQRLFAAAIPDPALASLLCSAAYLSVWVAICGWMYQRRIFVKL